MAVAEPYAAPPPGRRFRARVPALYGKIPGSSYLAFGALGLITPESIGVLPNNLRARNP